MRRPHESGRARRGLGVGAVVAIITIVPLLGASWFATREVIAAREELADVRDIDARVDDLVTLSLLRSRLADERSWMSGVRGLEAFGLTPELGRQLIGFDVRAEGDTAVADVDTLAATLGMPDIVAALARLRAMDPETAPLNGTHYESLELLVDERADELLDHVMASTGDIRHRGRLVDSLRILEAATTAGESTSQQFIRYFAARFPGFIDLPDNVTELAGHLARRSDALATIERLANDDHAVGGALDAVLGDDAVQRSEEQVIAVVNARPSAADDDPTTTILGEVEEIGRFFGDAMTTRQRHLDLVEAAGEDVDVATAAGRADAERANLLALGTLGIVLLASIAVAAASTRAIVRPIDRLADGAQRIRDGATDRSVSETGPREVREAARALNEAGDHLALAERQALALAQGDLEHESLSETTSGSLGESLQVAVQTLATSLQEREEFRRLMAHEATHDGLTQLPNRNASLTQLRRAIGRTSRTDDTLAVLFVDLDGFKEVNDHRGHPAGDHVLQVTARRLADGVREGDHVGRLGGDEFVVITGPVSGPDEVLALAEALRSAVSEPTEFEGGSVSVGASIGVALQQRVHQDASELLRDADLALYRAKGQGRNRVEICDDELRSAAAREADLEHAIRMALIGDELVVHYQPIVQPTTHDVVAYEALVRWNRPGHGLVGPGEFIPFAERSDLIIQIDRWVVERVARQIVTWEANGRMGDLPVSVNVSARHLASAEFVASILNPIDGYGIEPSRLVVEVTESALLDDLTSAAIKLQSLRQRGVRIAIDDFGTGYTSLAHLRNLPIDILKIDRSFTSDESAATLVELIVGTGHLLGATVTAEGIETPDQAMLVGAMGTDDLQGFLYGRPVPPEELEDPTTVLRTER